MTVTADSRGVSRDICSGLLWALGIDLVGTSAYVAVVGGAHPTLALVAVVGVSLAAVSVGVAVAALQRHRPSPRLLSIGLALALMGLAVNTAGSLPALSAPGVLLLLVGDALAAVYISLEVRALRVVSGRAVR